MIVVVRWNVGRIGPVRRRVWIGIGIEVGVGDDYIIAGTGFECPVGNAAVVYCAADSADGGIGVEDAVAVCRIGDPPVRYGSAVLLTYDCILGTMQNIAFQSARIKAIVVELVIAVVQIRVAIGRHVGLCRGRLLRHYVGAQFNCRREIQRRQIVL